MSGRYSLADWNRNRGMGPTESRVRLANTDATMASKAREGWPVFEAMLRANKLPAPQYEFRFDAVRKWRFDIAFPQYRIAIEVDGGSWGKSGHTDGEGFRRDLEKMNAATVAGWRVLRYPLESLYKAIDDIKALLYDGPVAA